MTTNILIESTKTLTVTANFKTKYNCFYFQKYQEVQ